MGLDHNRQVVGWHEKTGGELLENVTFIFHAGICRMKLNGQTNEIKEMSEQN